MSPDARIQIDALEDMTVGELRGKYLEVFGEPSRTRNKAFLKKRIAWRIQALEEGDLSDRARRRAFEIARDADLRIRAPREAPPAPLPSRHADDRIPAPGTILKTSYKGRTYRAVVLRNGFEYEGEHYKSLSAIAHVITGTRYNGFTFFGLGRKEVAK